MEKQLCVKCKKELVYIKSRKLCEKCYSKAYHRGEIQLSGKVIHISEMEFIKNYFKHNNWNYQPAIFNINNMKYSPDFYDQETNVFIEVANSRQAFLGNKEKYILFKKIYPKINFEIRNIQGELLKDYMREIEVYL